MNPQISSLSYCLLKVRDPFVQRSESVCTNFETRVLQILKKNLIAPVLKSMLNLTSCSLNKLYKNQNSYHRSDESLGSLFLEIHTTTL